ncbi:Mu transposase C-terminal domain-containing protein [Streptomyces tauricus]|uniref:Mu transposase C-terminal domain-containing protein n=1 Tax=Streptomyces tauricus TaxID=68274 RepID=UPI003446CD75
MWHHRPQEQLSHPLLPRASLAPQEMWEVLLGAAGRVPLPLAGQTYGELLPARRCAVTESGIRLGGRHYDDACLDEHRGRAGRFEVHHHPYDLRQVFIRLPDGLLHAIGWTQGAHTWRPFDETVRRSIVGVLARRDTGAQPDRETTGRDGGAGRTGETAAVRGTVDGTVHDGAGDGAGGHVVPESGGFGTYDAHAEAGQW